ncbi:MAG: hypothetical protein H6R25_3718 [Proteobacteria bacterium]|nr:hypothetical protein [Pseudomonadota bacterium]
MAVLTRPLSASEVQKAKPADKDYELFDGQGLTLFIRTTGKKIWRFRYKRPGSIVRTTITLGHYPAMSLASARTLHAEHLTLLVKGIAPKKQEQEKLNGNDWRWTVCLSMWQPNGLPGHQPSGRTMWRSPAVAERYYCPKWCEQSCSGAG